MARKDEIFNDLPPKLVAKLLPFQLDGIYDAICRQGRCLIADEMGLGKTLQAITVAYYYRSEWPALIIVPSSLKFAWIEELEKWLPELQPKEINLVQAGNDVNGLQTAKISLVSYGLLNKKTSSLVLEALMNQKFQVVIADESHYIKNIKTVSSKVVVPLIKKANRRILLSGTPALARPVELFPQLEALNTNVFGTFWEYTNRFCGARYEYFGKKRYRKVDGATNLDELQQKLLQTVMIRREKKDVLTQLPPKQRQRILFELKDSSLKKEIFCLFQQLKPKLSAVKGSSSQVGSDARTNLPFEILQSFQRLYKLSGETKIGPVQDYIKMLCSNNDLKFLVFAYHHDMMDGISQTLWDMKVKFIRIDGSTHPSDRQIFVQQFQTDPETSVAVLSILAAGVGLTFTAAKMVVFAEMYWTPGVMNQCEDRAHRIGQTSSLAVHYLVAKGTMDEWMWSILNRKTGVVSTILDGRREKLEAEKGNQDQIDILSNADVWDPKKCPDPVDISLMLQSQEPSDQKSILQFFTPAGCKKPSINSEKKSINEDSLDRNSLNTATKREKMKSQQKRSIDFNESSTSNESPHKKIKLSNSPLSKESPHKKNILSNSPTSKESPQKKIKLSNSPLSKESPHKKNILSNSPTSKESPQNKIKLSNSPTSKESPQNKIKLSNSPTSKESPQNKIKLSNSPTSKESPQNKIKLSNSPTSKESPFKKNIITCNPSSKESPNKKTTLRSDLITISDSDSDSDDSDFTKLSSPKITKSRFFTSKVNNEHKVESKSLRLELFKSHSNSRKSKSAQNQKIKDKNDKDIANTTKWNCPVCTFLNHKDLKICEMCDTEKRKDLDLVNQKMPVSKLENRTLSTPSSTKCNLSFDEVSTSSPRKDQSDSKIDQRVIYQSPSSKHKFTFRRTWKKNLEYSPILCEERKFDSSSKIELSMDKQHVEENFTNSPNKTESSIDEKNMTGNSYHDISSRSSDSDDADDSYSKISSEENICDSDGSTDQVTLESKDPVDESEPSIDCTMDGDQSVNLEETIKFDTLLYCCSQFTSRVHLYDQDRNPLNANFLPEDAEMDNFSELPDFMKHPHNLRLIRRFVREWNNLTETKRRLISKNKMIFANPILAYEEIRCDKNFTVQRHLSKGTVAQTSLISALKTQGSVRLISNKNSANELTVDEKEKDFNNTKGIVQALNSDGVPMCINCQKPYDNTLINEDTVKKAENAWSTRFCSYECMDNYLMKTKQGYCREKLFEIEHGICQMCGLDAESLFKEIKSQPDLKKRVKILQSSQLNGLTSKQKEAIIKNPSPGMFWQADHIQAVFKGGGQCDIDNYRTLCVLCHKKVTAEQTKQRAIEKKKRFASGTYDIKNFFKIS